MKNKELLERIERLEKRVAELEGKRAASPLDELKKKLLEDETWGRQKEYIPVPCPYPYYPAPQYPYPYPWSPPYTWC